MKNTTRFIPLLGVPPYPMVVRSLCPTSSSEKLRLNSILQFTQAVRSRKKLRLPTSSFRALLIPHWNRACRTPSPRTAFYRSSITDNKASLLRPSLLLRLPQPNCLLLYPPTFLCTHTLTPSSIAHPLLLLDPPYPRPPYRPQPLRPPPCPHLREPLPQPRLPPPQLHTFRIIARPVTAIIKTVGLLRILLAGY